MKSLVCTCLVLASTLASLSSAKLEFPQRFEGNGDLDSILDARLPLEPFPSDDLVRYLEADVFQFSGHDANFQLMFPSLTKEQQRFGINPSYPEFNAEIVGDPSHANDDDDSNDYEMENVAEDPMLINNMYLYPKKASLKALLNEDPVVLATAIEDDRIYDIYFTTIVGVASGLTVFLIVGAGFLFHRARKNAKAAEDVEYPAYGVTGPGKEISPTSGDRKLAQNAQLYHYQHQKQQMIAFDSNSGNDRRNGAVSDNESEDGEEGDYTVYECPGLAPTGEMEVRNPMFEDDTTPKATK